MFIINEKSNFLKEGITWKTRDGVKTPNYYGSITQASTIRIGEDQNGEEIFVPMNALLPMVIKKNKKKNFNIY